MRTDVREHVSSICTAWCPYPTSGILYRWVGFADPCVNFPAVCGAPISLAMTAGNLVLDGGPGVWDVFRRGWFYIRFLSSEPSVYWALG